MSEELRQLEVIFLRKLRGYCCDHCGCQERYLDINIKDAMDPVCNDRMLAMT
jgi:hypothetical protein